VSRKIRDSGFKGSRFNDLLFKITDYELQITDSRLQIQDSRFKDLRFSFEVLDLPLEFGIWNLEYL
jgi:hypothetical protein